MIYMAADNNLDYESTKDLKEIKTIGSNRRVQVLAFRDRIGDKSAQYFHLTNDRSLQEDDQGINLQEANTGDPNSLVKFVAWAREKFPARHYLLVLWGHGSGVLDTDFLTGGQPPPSMLLEARGKGGSRRLAPAKKLLQKLGRVPLQSLLPQHYQLYSRTLFLPSKLALLARDRRAKTAVAARYNRAKAIAIDYPDDEQMDYLDNKELKAAFGEIHQHLGQRVDVLGMDACLMSMAEISYQLRQDVQYLVGSQDLVTKEGFPYARILGRLKKNPKTTPRKLAQAMVDYYVKPPIPKKKSDIQFRTLAACDLTRAAADRDDSLHKVLDELARTLLDLSNDKRTETLVADKMRQIILEARGGAQYYDEGDYIDLFHFCELLLKHSAAHLKKEQRNLKRRNPKKNPRAYEQKKEFVQLLQQAGKKLEQSCQRVQRLFGPHGLVFAERHQGPLVKHSHGLSIYFPFKRIDPTYNKTNVDFVQDTAWEKLIRVFIRQTQWLRFLKEFSHNPRTKFRIKIA